MITAVRSVKSALRWRSWYYGTQLGRGVLLRSWKYPQVFPTCRDMAAYARTFAVVGADASPELLHVRAVPGGGLHCRPGTSDPWVLWDTFVYKFHLPPRQLAPDCCIVDLGANVGYTSAHFASLYDRARIVAVEMDAANAGLAAKNLAAFRPRCELLHAAVWSEDGQIQYGGDEEQGFRVSALDGAAASHDSRVVPARGLDSIFRQFGLETVDYLKMDIEGAESVVLRRSLDWAKRVRAMKIEVHPPATVRECAAILTAAGFRCAKDSAHPHGLIALRDAPIGPNGASREGRGQ